MSLTSAAAYPQFPRLAVGAVVFLDNRVLLVRRGQPPSADQWAIPGGRVRLGETLQQAAEREILEETGVVIKAGKPIYTFDMIERDADGGIRFHYIIVDLEADYVRGDLCGGDDAAEAKWVSAADLGGMKVNRQTLGLLKHQYDFLKDG